MKKHVPTSHPTKPKAGSAGTPVSHPTKPKSSTARKPISRPTKAKAGSAGTSTESAATRIDAKVKELGDWRGRMLAKVREIIHKADPEIVEEWKWAKATSPGTPVFSHGGIVCTGETYKSVVKMTFAKGASLPDPCGLFNSSLEGNVRRAIDIREGETIDEAALKDLIRAAVKLNLKSA